MQTEYFKGKMTEMLCLYHISSLHRSHQRENYMIIIPLDSFKCYYFTWQKHCLLESINRNKKYVFQFNLHWKNYSPFGCVKRAFVQIQNLSCPSFQRCLLWDRKQMEFLENWWWLQGSLNWILQLLQKWCRA